MLFQCDTDRCIHHLREDKQNFRMNCPGCNKPLQAINGQDSCARSYCTNYHPAATNLCPTHSASKREHNDALQEGWRSMKPRFSKRIPFVDSFSEKLTPIQFHGRCYPVSLHDLSIIQYVQEPISMASLNIKGKPLFTFGESPGYDSEDRSDAIEALEKLKTLGVKSILCVDTKRALNTHGLRPIAQTETLPELYRLLGLNVYFEHKGIHFHLADGAEVASSPMPKSDTKKLIELLIEHHVFGTAIDNHPEKMRLSPVINYLKNELLPTFPLDQRERMLREATFVPDGSQIKAYIGAMLEALEQGGVYLHCASGQGRTGFYVLLFVMYLTNCTFKEALHFMGIQYGCCHSEIEDYYSIGQDHEQLIDLIR